MNIPFLNSAARLRAKLRNVQWLVCDLDGTLLSDSNEISQQSMKSIEKLNSLNVRILLASGRTDGFIRQYATQISSSFPVISLNGALVRNVEHVALYQALIPTQIGETIHTEILNSTDTAHSVFTADGIFSQSFPLQLPRYLRSYPLEHAQVEFLSPYFQNAVQYVVAGPYSVVQNISVLLAKSFKNYVERICYPSQSGDGKYYLEIRNRNVTKGNAIRYLSKTHGMSAKKIAAIGDHTNDIEMCKFAGVSAAMRNGVSQLKENVDFITRYSNNEDGVVEFMNLILEAKTKGEAT